MAQRKNLQLERRTVLKPAGKGGDERRNQRPERQSNDESQLSHYQTGICENHSSADCIGITVHA